MSGQPEPCEARYRLADGARFHARVLCRNDVYDLPQDWLPVAAVPAGDSVLIATRRVAAGGLALWRLSAGEAHAVALDTNLAGSAPLGLTVRPDGGALLMSYDPVAAQTFAHAVDCDAAGCELAWRSPPLTFGAQTDIDASLFFPQTDDLTVCGGEACYVWDMLGSDPRRVRVGPGLMLVDAAENAQTGTIGLFVRIVDDRSVWFPRADEPVYFTASLPDGRLAPLPPGEPAWRLDPSGVPVPVRTVEAFEQMLVRDFTRGALSGAQWLGADNAEGRVSWSWHYYVSGLLDVAEFADRFSFLSPKLRADMAERVRLELDLAGRLLEDGAAGLHTRRYSLNREPLLSRLVAGRFLLVAARDPALHASNDAKTLFERAILNDTGMLESIEHDAEAGVRLRLRRGAPFWSDGLVAAMNYHTGWVEGIVCFAPDDPRVRTLAAGMDWVGDLIASDSARTGYLSWRYWVGAGYRGWSRSDDLSDNTPEYPGYAEDAHISYRSMDARMLLALDAAGVGGRTGPGPEALAAAVEAGALWPTVMPALLRAQTDARLPVSTARVHLRVAEPWMLRNALWAASAVYTGAEAGPAASPD